MSQFTATILLSTLHEGQEEAYDAAHARIPDDLFETLSGAGVRDWAIWRDDRSLLHVVDVDDYDAMGAAIASSPVNARWQQEMAAYVAEFHEVRTVPALKNPHLVWSMDQQRRERQEGRA